MIKNRFPEIKPGRRYLKRAYSSTIMLLLGRAIEAAAEVDESIKKIFEGLPDDFTFLLGVAPAGPNMIVGKDKNGGVKYLGWKPSNRNIQLEMRIKNMELAFRIFTFRESTAYASSNDRFLIMGDLAHALAVVRILDIVEIYLLPRIIAELAVKRYPAETEFPPLKKHVNRGRIYVKTFFHPDLFRVAFNNLRNRSTTT